MSIISCFPGGGSALKAQKITVASGGSQTVFTFTSLTELKMVFMKVNYLDSSWVLIMQVDGLWIDASTMAVYASPSYGFMKMTASGNTITAENIAATYGGYIVGYGTYDTAFI